VIASAPAIEPATRTLPVRMKLSTKVSILPVTLQLTALTIERKWESRTRMNIGSSASGVGIKSPNLGATSFVKKEKARHGTGGSTSPPAAGALVDLVIGRAAMEKVFWIARRTPWSARCSPKMQ
jgi:hypothetical protein